MPTEPIPRLDALRATAKHRSARVKLAVARILRAEIDRLVLTVADVARLSQLPDQTVRQYFNGTVEPSVSRLMALESALADGRKPGWFFTRLIHRADPGPS